MENKLTLSISEINRTDSTEWTVKFLMKEDVVEYQSVHKQGEKKYVR